MKITTFNPMIITKQPEAAIALFEALGFERRHTKTEDGDIDFSAVRMKDENGFHVDVVTSEKIPSEHDLTAIRINVDDFDAAAELLKSHGFRESQAFGVHYTPSSKYAYFISPSGFLVDLCKHMKQDE